MRSYIRVSNTTPPGCIWKQLFWLKLVAQQGFRSSKRITWSFGNVCWTHCLATALPRGLRFSWKRFSVKRSFRRFHEQYAQPFETSCPVWKIKIGCGKWVHIAHTHKLLALSRWLGRSAKGSNMNNYFRPVFPSSCWIRIDKWMLEGCFSKQL